jgi:hypothetical protein
MNFDMGDIDTVKNPALYILLLVASVVAILMAIFRWFALWRFGK